MYGNNKKEDEEKHHCLHMINADVMRTDFNVGLFVKINPSVPRPLHRVLCAFLPNNAHSFKVPSLFYSRPEQSRATCKLRLHGTFTKRDKLCLNNGWLRLLPCMCPQLTRSLLILLKIKSQ